MNVFIIKHNEINTTKQVRCFSRHAWGAGVALHAEALGVVIPSALTAVSNMPAASETTLERQRRRTWHMKMWACLAQVCPGFVFFTEIQHSSKDWWHTGAGIKADWQCSPTCWKMKFHSVLSQKLILRIVTRGSSGNHLQRIFLLQDIESTKGSKLDSADCDGPGTPGRIVFLDTPRSGSDVGWDSIGVGT